MRKTILFALLVLWSKCILAQNGAVTINNTTADEIDVYMYGHDAGYFGQGHGACNELRTRVISIPANSSKTIADEYDMQNSVGWAESPGTYSANQQSHTIVWTHVKMYVRYAIPGRCDYSKGLYLTDEAYGCETSPPFTKSNLTVSNGCTHASWMRIDGGQNGIGDDIAITIH